MATQRKRRKVAPRTPAAASKSASAANPIAPTTPAPPESTPRRLAAYGGTTTPSSGWTSPIFTTMGVGLGSHHVSVGSGSTVWDNTALLKSDPTFFSRALTLPSAREEQLAAEIEQLRQQVNANAKKAVDAAKVKGEGERELEQLRTSLAQWKAKEHVSFVLTRIHPDARDLLLQNSAFADAFLNQQTCDSFVMSVDIRRSTELMLKARQPQLYAEFITTLCAQLRDIVLAHHGVFDKFTGDGVLAFFPDFYTGSDAGYLAIAAADSCHRAFAEHYGSSRRCFTSVLSGIGLGIGIDYGTTHLVQVGDGLTVVGTPVVYACRMGSGSAGVTLLNQPAYEQVFDKFSGLCTFAETELDAKHEGKHVAYSVCLNGKAYTPKAPAWDSFAAGTTSSAASEEGLLETRVTTKDS